MNKNETFDAKKTLSCCELIFLTKMYVRKYNLRKRNITDTNFLYNTDNTINSVNLSLKRV